MPIPPLAPNPSNGITVEYVEYVAKIVLPFISIIVGLVVWTWKKMERSIDKVSEALELHVESDEEIHDHLFTASRKTGEKLAELIGAHNATHPCLTQMEIKTYTPPAHNRRITDKKE